MQRLITLFPSARSHPPQKIQDDHLLLVFGFLDAWVLRVFMQTCKQFHRVACEDVLWRALLVAEIGESNVPALPLPDGPGGWRHRFIQWQRLGSCTLMTTPRPRAEPLDVGPTARFLHRAACLDSGRWLYVFGGRGQTDEFNDLWLLDINAMALRNVAVEPPAPEPRSRHTTHMIGDSLHVFAGYDGSKPVAGDVFTLDCSDPGGMEGTEAGGGDGKKDEKKKADDDDED